MARLSGSTSQKRAFVGAALSAVVGLSVLAGADAEARAEGPVVGTGKGIVGTALLGGEAVAIGMAAFGVEKGWTYLVFPPLAAVGGGIGGYFIEQAAPPAEVPLYLLAGGMALVIPTVIVTLNATVYKAPIDYPNEPVQNKPAGEPPTPTPTARTRGGSIFAQIKPPVHLPMSLFDVYEGRVATGFPAVQIKPLYTNEEMAKFGVAQGREVNIPIFKASF